MFENMPQKLIRTPVGYASLEHLAWREKDPVGGLLTIYVLKTIWKSLKTNLNTVFAIKVTFKNFCDTAVVWFVFTSVTTSLKRLVKHIASS